MLLVMKFLTYKCHFVLEYVLMGLNLLKIHGNLLVKTVPLEIGWPRILVYNLNCQTEVLKYKHNDISMMKFMREINSYLNHIHFVIGLKQMKHGNVLVLQSWVQMPQMVWSTQDHCLIFCSSILKCRINDNSLLKFVREIKSYLNQIQFVIGL